MSLNWVGGYIIVFSVCVTQGCSFGYHAGGWGKTPVDEEGKPLYGDVFGTAAAAVTVSINCLFPDLVMSSAFSVIHLLSTSIVYVTSHWKRHLYSFPSSFCFAII